MRTVAEVNNPQARAALPCVPSVDELLVTSKVASRLLARSALYPGLSAIVTDIVSGGEGSELYRIALPGRVHRAVDRRRSRTLLRSDHKATLLSVNRGGRAFVNPGTDFVLQAGDDAIVVAEGLGTLAPLKLHDINDRAAERLGGAERLTGRQAAADAVAA